MPKQKLDFCLFKKQTSAGKVWYVKFKDNFKNRYVSVKSTGIPVDGKREHRREAEDAAQKLYVSFTEKKLSTEVVNMPLFRFLLDFWTPTSDYVREKRAVEKKPLSATYIGGSHKNIEKFVMPFPDFKSITVGELTRAKVRAWKLWAAEKGLSGRKINIVLQAMRVPIRDAYRDEKIPSDPFLNIGEASHNKKEKGILTPAEVSSLIKKETKNPRWKLVVLLGCLCGLRRGEIRGLQWGDIGDGVINIKHNFIDGDGLKAPKCNSSRLVPYPISIKNLLSTVRSVSVNTTPESYIFEQIITEKKTEEGKVTDNIKTPGTPVTGTFFRYALDRELSEIGIPGEWPKWRKKKAPEGYVNEQKKRNLSLHSLRHTFITLGRIAGITDVEIQAMAGHRNERMMSYYTHAGQVLDFKTAREKLEKIIESAG